MNRKEPTRLLMHNLTTSAATFHMALHELKSDVAMHWHDFYELSLVIEGEGSQVLNGVEEPLKRGVLLLLTPADFHEVRNKPGDALKKFNVIFSHELLDDRVKLLLFGDLHPKSIQLAQGDIDRIEADFHRLWGEYRSHGEGRMLSIEYLLNLILIELVRCGTGGLRLNEGRSSASTAIHQALVHIQHHFREAMTLERIARQVSMSPNYFSQCFHKETGTTFQQHLLSVRLQFAKSLLISSEMTVTEVCLASGFHTLNHFERAFKKRYGCTPRMVRR